jgi:purine-nucleoside phosphorylase
MLLGSKLARLPDPIHLHPTAPLAERVLLPGDPGRALLLAQTLLEEPKMFNHNRGLWGYSGRANGDGELLTIQSTGMGGPSAAIVISELAELGARRLLRVGTCGALEPRLELGQLIVAGQALCDDGTSRALCGEQVLRGSGPLTGSVAAALDQEPVTVVSTDLFYGFEDREHDWLRSGAQAVEMETATLFALARRRQLEAAALLIVSDLLRPQRLRIEKPGLQEAERRMGELAIRALS